MNLLLFFAVMPLSLAIQASPFIIAGTPEPPFKMRSKSDLEGGIEGIDVDIVAHIMEQLGVDYEIQLIESGARIIREAELGRLDMVMSFSFKDSRTNYLIYPSQSYKTVSWHFFVHQDNYSKFRFEQLSDLSGAVIGAVNGWAYTPEFWGAGLNIWPVSKHTLLLNMLRSRIDLAPLNTVETLYELKHRGLKIRIVYLPKPLVARPYFNAFVKKSKHPNKERVMRGYDALVKRLMVKGYVDQVYDFYLEESEFGIK
ncbi:ABC transporter substrate-binding protein [Litoribacillus peritrichatus]|uniref:Transporter substrate-binding domain-containing protein n=1 Tax=Litoribacillus peritrichatus TaxID=718191 RepID=A0ABP7N9V1_9GAMM